MKLGVVDVGGGMRGVFAAGVLDYCLESGIKFDCCIGVSAGSANLITYLAGQKERNFKFYHEYSFRKKYMGLSNFIFGGSYFNLEYIYGTLANSVGENPLDYAAFKKNPADFFVVAEDAESGSPVYFTRNNIKKDDSRVLMASSSIPGINKPFNITGRNYFDGALADPVPIQKAFMEGCDRVVLLLSKPVNEPFDYQTDVFLANLIRNQFPASANKLMLRAEKYERSIALANQYASMNRLLFIVPDETFGVTATKRTKKGIEKLYAHGKAQGEKISDWLKT